MIREIFTRGTEANKWTWVVLWGLFIGFAFSTIRLYVEEQQVVAEEPLFKFPPPGFSEKDMVFLDGWECYYPENSGGKAKRLPRNWRALLEPLRPERGVEIWKQATREKNYDEDGTGLLGPFLVPVAINNGQPTAYVDADDMVEVVVQLKDGKRFRLQLKIVEDEEKNR